MLWFKKPHILIVNLNIAFSVLYFEVISFANASKDAPHFLFFQVHCILLDVEVFDPPRLEICSGIIMVLFAFSCMKTSRQTTTICLRFCLISCVFMASLSKHRSELMSDPQLNFTNQHSVFMPITYGFNYYNSVEQLEIMDGDTFLAFL